MGPNRYPACVLFYFAIVMSFLAMGRVALRARDFARTRISLCWKSRAAEIRRFAAQRPFVADSGCGTKAASLQL